MTRTNSAHPDANDRFMHGGVYHVLWDRPLATARRIVTDSVPIGSTVLDVACGTGELCFELAAQKSCHVVGIDLSRRMIEFAQKRNQYDTVHFVHGSAADLTCFEPRKFDIATILFLFHEVPRQIQISTLEGALSIARKVIIVDSLAPLPRNLHGTALRLVEAIGGPKHYRSFADYLEAGGVGGILADSSLRATVTQRCVFWYGCREMVVIQNPGGMHA